MPGHPFGQPEPRLWALGIKTGEVKGAEVYATDVPAFRRRLQGKERDYLVEREPLDLEWVRK